MTWLGTWYCEFLIMFLSIPRMKVFQTVVSLKSLVLGLAESGVFFAASAGLEGSDVLSPDSSLDSAGEEGLVLGSSGSVFCPLSGGSCRNWGTSSCSLVRRPRWSSTRQHWALVSMSKNPDAVKKNYVKPGNNLKKNKYRGAILVCLRYSHFVTQCVGCVLCHKLFLSWLNTRAGQYEYIWIQFLIYIAITSWNYNWETSD